MPSYSIFNFQDCVEPDRPRVLPDEVCPGVPWPPGFKEGIDNWMKGFFKPRNYIDDFQVVKLGNVFHVNPRTYELLKTKLPESIAPWAPTMRDST